MTQPATDPTWSTSASSPLTARIGVAYVRDVHRPGEHGTPPQVVGLSRRARVIDRGRSVRIPAMQAVLHALSLARSGYGRRMPRDLQLVTVAQALVLQGVDPH